MTFDNKETVIGVRIKLFTATVLLIAFLVMTYFAEIIKFPLLGMDEAFWTFLLVILYVAIIAYPSIAVYQYFYFSDEGSALIFRYFTAGIIGGRKNSIEIPKKFYHGFELKNEYMGLRQYIILYQKTASGIAQYPPIYISALNNKEKAKLIEAITL